MSKISDRILYNEPLNQRSNVDLGVRSILRNMQYILNTRSSLGIKNFLASDTILDNLSFGLPDLTFLSIHSTTDKKTLIDVIKKAIDAFEPRLKGVSIELGSHNPIKKEITVKVLAHFDRDNIAVNFILNLNTLEFLIDEREQ